jgi:hypothetical protein
MRSDFGGPGINPHQWAITDQDSEAAVVNLFTEKPAECTILFPFNAPTVSCQFFKFLGAQGPKILVQGPRPDHNK